MSRHGLFPVLGLAVVALAFASGGMRALADDFAPGQFGADAIFVHPLDTSGADDSVRAAFSVTPVVLDTNFAEIEILPGELTASTNIASGKMELTKFQAAALRLAFSQVMPVQLLSVYRNLDQGIDWGGDLISVRVPIRVTPGGEIIVQPGLDLGVRHYVAPVDKTAVNASFSIEARAAASLIENFMSTGVMARVRYDLNNGGMSGFEEAGMGYLSFLLDRDHRLYARVYAGIEHQSSREQLGLPTVDVYTGVGIFGSFGK